MAYFNTKETRYVPQPIPPTPPYNPPVPPTPPTPEGGSTPEIPRPTFSGETTITFYISTDETSKIGKSFKSPIALTGAFKDDVDILNPVLVLQSDTDLSDHNYFKMLGRTYHVTSCQLMTGGLYKIIGLVDVLDTYSAGIKSLEVIADKVQQSTYSSQDINDESHINSSGVQRELINFDITEGSSFTEYPNLILITIGGQEVSEG